MSPPRSPATKGYVDRGIQTISPPAIWLARSVSSSTQNSSTRAHNGSLSEYSSNAPTSTHSHSRSSSKLDSAYSHSLPPDSPSPVRSMITARRTFKRQKTPYSRPSPEKLQTRVVSLPDNPSMYRADAAHDSTTLRVVSVPDHLPSSYMFIGNNTSDVTDPSLCLDHSVFAGNEKNSRIRVRPPQVNAPHTPSPPSSPDSVLFIDNDHQLSKTFLCRNSVPKSQQLLSDDDGWITWATSPPRPIPALHGPLSLPYARCPSGAEGTIIEEHDNLPRMIWGLGADDAPSTHSSVGSHNSHHVTAHINTHNSHPKAPPRFQTTQASPAYLATPQQTPLLSLNSRGHRTTLSDHRRKTQASTHQHTLENLGFRPHDTNGSSIALDNMLRLGTAKVAGTWDSLYGTLAHRSQDAAIETFDMNNGIALDWQVTHARKSLRNPPVEDSRGTKITHLLKPSAPAFVPGRQVTPLPFPRIFVEPRSTQSYQELNQPHRIPASDIPQQYRQHQSILPTPPSSTSPQWSSSFSPYQGPLYSPLPVQQKQRPPADSSSELRRFVYERIGSGGQNQANCHPSAIFQNYEAIKSQPVLARSPNVSRRHPHTQRLSVPSNCVKSPPHPGPPPSTPLPPVPSTASVVIRDSEYWLGRSPSSDMPLSPTPPESRPRSVSYQHPRSVPLARLIQRRLASVPEEDLNFYLEHDRSSSPLLCSQKTKNSVPQVYVPPEQTASQTGQYQKQLLSIRTPSPVPPILVPRSRTECEYDSGELLIDSGSRTMSGLEYFPAKVRLPYTSIKTLPVEQQRGGCDERVSRRSKERKENVTKGEVGSRDMNSRKKGRGKKIQKDGTRRAIGM